MQNPYNILNIDPNSSIDELDAQYALLKAQYSEERFLPGSKGNEAADKLTELEIAYKEILNQLALKGGNASNTTYDFSAIAKLIESGKYSDAQGMLDNISLHTAEWHYTQAMLFYRREFTLEAKNQLEMALKKEPYNTKYISALERLRFVMGNPKIDPTTLGNQPPPEDSIMQETNQILGPCSNCCCAALCADCCCTCFRCGS